MHSYLNSIVLMNLVSPPLLHVSVLSSISLNREDTGSIAICAFIHPRECCAFLTAIATIVVELSHTFDLMDSRRLQRLDREVFPRYSLSFHSLPSRIISRPLSRCLQSRRPCGTSRGERSASYRNTQILPSWELQANVF